jgi:tRNA 2-thiouridine synthesizing protein E
LVISTDENLIQRLSYHESPDLAIRFARSAYEASAVVQSFPPAFAVIDGESFPPDEGGLIDDLSSDPRLPGLKIIVAIPGDTDRWPTHNNGHNAPHVIDRPFGLDQIRTVVENYPVESGSFDELAALGLNLEGEPAMVAQKQAALLSTEVNDDGFLFDMATWNRSAAEELAVEHNIGPLTEDHWRVIEFVQEHYQTYGRGPEVIKIHKETGLSTKDICKLFPCGMVKGAYRLAGLPRPPGCG